MKLTLKKTKLILHNHETNSVRVHMIHMIHMILYGLNDKYSKLWTLNTQRTLKIVLKSLPNNKSRTNLLHTYKISK